MSKEFKSRGFKKFKFIVIFIFIIFSFCTLLPTRYTLSLYPLPATRYTLIPDAYAGITGTKHDLSSDGGQTIRATTVTQKCVFCHTPHSSSKEGPLWNHSLSSATYSVRFEASGYYGDPWRVTLAKQPDGSSRLCLGCHDGTVALGLLVNVPGSGMGGTVDMTQTYMPCGPTDYTCLGTDFISSGKHLDGFGTGDHLISMEYNSALYTDVLAKCYPPESSVTYPIRDPGTISSTDPVKLYKTRHVYPPGADADGKVGVQCRSCHDPHDNTNEKFLVKGSPADWDPLCNTCHMTCP